MVFVTLLTEENLFAEAKMFLRGKGYKPTASSVAGIVEVELRKLLRSLGIEL